MSLGGPWERTADAPGQLIQRPLAQRAVLAVAAFGMSKKSPIYGAVGLGLVVSRPKVLEMLVVWMMGR